MTSKIFRQSLVQHVELNDFVVGFLEFLTFGTRMSQMHLIRKLVSVLQIESVSV